MSNHNAEEIIERFGGIRPMASKLDIPVTTVQGWKKRKLIPENRWPEIRKCAEQNNIDLSGLLNAQQPPAAGAPAKTHNVSNNQASANTAKTQTDIDSLIEQRVQERLQNFEKKTVTKSAIINIALLLITLAALSALLWPYKKIPERNQDVIRSLETEVTTLQKNVATLQKEKSALENLKAQAAHMKDTAQGAMSEAKMLATDLTTGTFEDRIAKLESRMGSDTVSSTMSALLARFQSLTASPQGEALLNTVTAQLNILIPENAPPEKIDAALENAAAQDPAIAATFQDIPAEDLKAAAMLLAMTQFRTSLGRDNQPFQNDLDLLMKLNAESDPELKDSLLKLAPYAEQGILTPRGLTDEFKTMAGDAVVASLQGEDISVKDKARARLNEVFKVEKNGELITGTPTQATLNRAEKNLEGGNIEAALAEMQNLQGPAALAARPWMNKAEAALIAQKLKLSLSHAIHAKASGKITAAGAGLLPGRLIQNKETGINILQPGTMDIPGLPKKN